MVEQTGNRYSFPRKTATLWKVLRVGGLLLSVGAVFYSVSNMVIRAVAASLRISANKEYRQRLPFDSIAWKTRAYDSDKNRMRSTRLRMIDDLIKIGLLKRKSRAEVVELLGVPDVERDTLVYILGPERGFGVDNECLQIHFDAKGHVCELKITTD